MKQASEGDRMNKIIHLLREELGDTLFNDICDFIDELYLMEYDLLILMARKFYSLFCVFHEINRRRHEILSIPYECKGKIITNRALPLLKGKLNNGLYNKVLIADDIIIHGRTIKEVYDEVIGCNQDIEARVLSYYCNEERNEVYESIKEKVFARYKVRIGERKELSDKIVNTFFLSGRPYVSYVPFFELDIKWEDLCNNIKDDYINIACGGMQQYEIKAIAYSGDEVSLFNELPYCGTSIIRFYNYQKIDKIIAIPYFVMESINYDKMVKFSDIIRESFLMKEYQKILLSGGNVDENRVMEAEYIFSAWLGMYFFDKFKISIKKWHKEIEKHNFVTYLLPEKILRAEEIENTIKSIKIEDGLLPSITIPLADANDQEDTNYKCLYYKYEQLKKKYRKLYSEHKKEEVTWKKDEEEIDSIYRFVMELIAENGNIDEAQYNETSQNGKSGLYARRLYGLPLLRLVDELAEYFVSLEFSGNNLKNHILAAIIMAADSGRATIVTRVVHGKDNIYFYESLVHAGEQNYKFYEETNFPGLYGLYIVELDAKRYRENIKKCKNSFLEKYVNYMREKGIFCDKEEMLQFINTDISKTYGEYLSYSYNRYCREPVVLDVINMAANHVRSN